MLLGQTGLSCARGTHNSPVTDMCGFSKAPHLTQWLTRSPALVRSHRLKASDKEVPHGTQRDSLVQDSLTLPTQSVVSEVCLSSVQEAMRVLLQQPSGPSGQDSSH